MESTLREYKSPRKRFCRQHLATLTTLRILRLASLEFPDGAILQTIAGFCKQSPVYGVFWPLLPHLSSDRNETRSWSSLPPRNLHIKFGTNPSTIFLVIVVTDRQTDTHTHTNKPTPVKIYSLAFAGIIKLFTDTVPLYNYWPIGIFYRNPDRHRILLQASWCVVYDAVSSRVAYKTQEHDAVAITYVRASQTERRARAATATEYSNIE